MYRPLAESEIPKLLPGDRLKRGDVDFVIAGKWGSQIFAVHVENVREEDLGGGKWEIWEDEERPLAPIVLLKPKVKEVAPFES